MSTFWERVLAGEGKPAIGPNGIAVWISQLAREDWHDQYHWGVEYAECDICHDDKTLYEEMRQVQEEDAAEEEALFWEDDDDDER